MSLYLLVGDDSGWEEEPPPTTRCEFIPLNQYHNVLLVKGGETCVANIISHLSLADWATMHNARVWVGGQHSYLDPHTTERSKFDPIVFDDAG